MKNAWKCLTVLFFVSFFVLIVLMFVFISPDPVVRDSNARAQVGQTILFIVIELVLAHFIQWTGERAGWLKHGF
jgi:hypothetical protein